mmetsp:Transcript_50523/g.133122  ORF Transcript_50523/g.133122 Transcript_50523/m.133122 type:complete len:226 (+) Transcript_50523:896-1573(+)
MSSAEMLLTTSTESRGHARVWRMTSMHRRCDTASSTYKVIQMSRTAAETRAGSGPSLSLSAAFFGEPPCQGRGSRASPASYASSVSSAGKAPSTTADSHVPTTICASRAASPCSARRTPTVVAASACASACRLGCRARASQLRRRYSRSSPVPTNGLYRLVSRGWAASTHSSRVSRVVTARSIWNPDRVKALECSPSTARKAAGRKVRRRWRARPLRHCRSTDTT